MDITTIPWPISTSSLTFISMLSNNTHPPKHQSVDSNTLMIIDWMERSRRRIAIQSSSGRTIFVPQPFAANAGDSNETKHRTHPESIIGCYRRDIGGNGWPISLLIVSTRAYTAMVSVFWGECGSAFF